MEDTLKSAGVDTVEARAHFDNDSVAKNNMGSTPGELQECNLVGESVPCIAKGLEDWAIGRWGRIPRKFQ